MTKLTYEQLGLPQAEIDGIVRELDSKQIEDIAESEIMAAAIMNGQRSDDGRHDRGAHACYTILNERDELWRYIRAHNSCMESQGYSGDRDGAVPPPRYVADACREGERRVVAKLGGKVMSRSRPIVNGKEDDYSIQRDLRIDSAMHDVTLVVMLDSATATRAYYLDGERLGEIEKLDDQT